MRGSRTATATRSRVSTGALPVCPSAASRIRRFNFRPDVVLNNTGLERYPEGRWITRTPRGRRSRPAYWLSFLGVLPPVAPVVLGSSTEWMLGSTPPAAIVTPASSLDSSSSLRTASWMCRGMMRVFLLSRAALPASSRTSAHRYSRTAARYTGAPAPTRVAYLPFFRYRAMRPTGNWSPALDDRVWAFLPDALPRPLPDMLVGERTDRWGTDGRLCQPGAWPGPLEAPPGGDVPWPGDDLGKMGGGFGVLLGIGRLADRLLRLSHCKIRPQRPLRQPRSPAARRSVRRVRYPGGPAGRAHLARAGPGAGQ